MRNAIKYFYNLDVDRLQNYYNGYLFDKYYIKEIKNNFDYELYNYLIHNNINVNRIIKNNNNEYITIIDNKYYMLLNIDNRVNLDIDNINSFFKEVKTNREINWAKLWELKVDYYEKEMLKINSKDILKIFPYYIGLSENAIRVYKENNGDCKIGICHRRLDNSIDFYSPDNIIIDYYVRDISEYIKYLFFQEEKDNYEIINIINTLYLTNDEYILLYSRLLFPSYFYDCIENNEDIIKYSSKINQYERFLKMYYENLKGRVNLPRIDWLIKKDMD